jgi:membrane associated rhomboid family serine protease
VALLDRLLRLLGTNRTRVAWKWRALKASLGRSKRRAANRGAAVTYGHQTCPSCSHPADRGAAECSRCGARLSGMAVQRTRRVASAVGLDLPVVTIGLLLVFAALLLATLSWTRGHELGPTRAGAPSSMALVTYGAAYGPTIAAGEWWRLLTYAFLHGDFLHLIMNGLSLWSVGRLLEQRLGATRTLSLFVATSIVAGLGSLAWHEWIRGGVMFSVGASGGVCGLIGVVVGLASRRRNAMRELRQHYVGWIIWIAILSFAARVDAAAHAAGFLAGFGIGLLLRLPDPRARWAPRLWLGGAALSLAAVIGAFALTRQTAGTERGRLAMAGVSSAYVARAQADLDAEFTEVHTLMQRASAFERGEAGASWLRAFADVGSLERTPHRDALRALWGDVVTAANGAPTTVMSEPALAELGAIGRRLGVPEVEVASAIAAARKRSPAAQAPPQPAP